MRVTKEMHNKELQKGFSIMKLSSAVSMTATIPCYGWMKMQERWTSYPTS